MQDTNKRQDSGLIRAANRRERRAGMDNWFMAGTAEDPTAKGKVEIKPLEVEGFETPKEKMMRELAEARIRRTESVRQLSDRAKSEVGEFVSYWLDRYAQRFCK